MAVPSFGVLFEIWVDVIREAKLLKRKSMSAFGSFKAPAVNKVEYQLRQCNRQTKQSLLIPFPFVLLCPLPHFCQSCLPPGRDSDDGAFHPFNGLYVCGPRSGQLQGPAHTFQGSVHTFPRSQEIEVSVFAAQNNYPAKSGLQP